MSSPGLDTLGFCDEKVRGNQNPHPVAKCATRVGHPLGTCIPYYFAAGT
jgi:hypothetical protein